MACEISKNFVHSVNFRETGQFSKAVCEVARFSVKYVATYLCNMITYQTSIIQRSFKTQQQYVYITETRWSIT